MSKLTIEWEMWGDRQLKAMIDGQAFASVTPEAAVESLTTGFLPPMVRWFDPTQRYWLLELPPSYMAISYYDVAHMAATKYRPWASTVNKYEQVSSATIPIPWQVWLFDASYPRGPSLWFRTEPLTSLDDEVFHCYLPNVYSWDTPCFYQYKDVENITDIPQRLKAVLQEFWFGAFDGSSYMLSKPPEGPAPGYPSELMDIWTNTPEYKKYTDLRDTTHNLNSVFPHLANLSIEDVLGWSYISAGPLNTPIEKKLREVTFSSVLQKMGLKS